MRGPSLHATTVLSVALHLAFFLIAALVLRHSRSVLMPSPYEVSLIGPTSSSQGTATREPAFQKQTVTQSPEQVKQPKKPEKTINDTKADQTKADQKQIDDRLAELASMKRIKRIAGLRKIVTVSGSAEHSAKKSGQGSGTDARSSGRGTGSYEDMIASEIARQIIFPEAGELQLTTIVFVRIMKDGTIQIQDIEKRSGNMLFDRAALRAIEKASPVTPPLKEMEIGLKLHPYGTEK